jgi:hypothetical protein
MSLGVTAEEMLLAAAAGAAESPLEAETGLRETAACTAAAAWEAGEAVIPVSSVKVSTLSYSTIRDIAVHALSLTQHCVIIIFVALSDSLQHDACVAWMLQHSIPCIERCTFVIKVCSGRSACDE